MRPTPGEPILGRGACVIAIFFCSSFCEIQPDKGKKKKEENLWASLSFAG
jgi:hypothetical protein